MKKEKNLLSSRKNRKNPVSVDGVVYYDFDDVDEVKVISTTPCCTKKRRNIFSGISVFEIGDSSGTKKNVN